MILTSKQRAQYIIADFLAANVAWLAFNVVRYFTLPSIYEADNLLNYLCYPNVRVGQILFPAMMVILIAISGYYNKVFMKSRLDDAINAAGVSAIGTLIIFFTVLFNDKFDDRMGNFEMIAVLWLLFSILLILPRSILTAATAKKIWRREIVFNAIIVGKWQQANELADSLDTKYRNMGFRVVGVLDDSINAWAKGNSKLPTYDYDQAMAMAASDEISAFIIMPDRSDSPHTMSVINKLLPLGKSIYLTPDTYLFIASRPRTSRVAGQLLIDVSSVDMPQSTLNIKRISDIIASALALVVFSPVFLAISLFIKADSKGPVFYKQERLGYKKRPFNIYKFRSMRTDAEEGGPALSSVNDSRITKVGRALRKYRLDELPQFWNVLKGDMSIVGPRPEREYYFKQIIERAPYFTMVHQVRPGITSWGMVKYGYASTVDEMLQRMRYDLLYIENISFAVDIKILFYTVRTVLTGRGV